MTEAAQAYEFPAIPSQKELDDNDIPFLNRDKCAAHLITYYKCLNKGTSFCSASKDQFYECQYIALKERLGKK
ncbi:CIC11C00000005026 [Sungouiella intermedia]|uniref:CIC11C00000001419 n=1 Tax=Sungouiella intermedia TaxID=45354 RepID=A0A1L0DA33_9ASCO|nr:CIC11C00000005026 [[Candida] intermedia]SGZ49267.1 CIC11C00000001419 [[Candida] intermedia]